MLERQNGMQIKYMSLLLCVAMFCPFVASQSDEAVKPVTLQQGQERSFDISFIKIVAQNTDGSLYVTIVIPSDRIDVSKPESKARVTSGERITEWDYLSVLAISQVSRIETSFGVFKTSPDASLQMSVSQDEKNRYLRCKVKNGRISCYFGEGNFFNIFQLSSAGWQVCAQNIFGNELLKAPPSHSPGRGIQLPLKPKPRPDPGTKPKIPISRP